MLLLVASLVVLLLGTSVASASKVTMTSKLRPSNAGKDRCTSQTIAVTTPAATATPGGTLLVSNIDSARCNGLPLTVVVYDPKLSATWSAAQKLSVSTTVGAATSVTLTATGGATFTPMVAQRTIVMIGGWQVPSTFVPGTPTTLRNVRMYENDHQKCLEVKGGTYANGTPVQISTCTGNARQRWSIMSDGTLRSNGTWCMTVPGGVAADVTYLTIEPCNAGQGAAQQWVPDSTRSEPGTFQFVSGLWWMPNPTINGCLDNPASANANGTQQIVYQCINNHINQDWVLTTVP